MSINYSMPWSKALHIETRGSGPDLVMLHGWSMHSGVFHQLTALLETQFTVHLVDLPGHGHSDWHEGDLQLDSLLAKLAEQLPQQVVLLGWSLGGLIATAFAQAYPQRVTKLILLAATPRFVVADDWPYAVEASVFENFASQLQHDQTETLQRFLLLQARGSKQSKETLQAISAELAQQHSPNPAALQAGLGLLAELDMREALTQISCPMLCLVGQRDTLIPVAMLEQLKQLKPSIETAVIAGAGHAPFIAQAASCEQVIREFIYD
jgi:pimeloyl-[acyl-carrier protein] methyl ester esterase